jgi:RNA polymerase sigma-70 factor, ECF subfamily
MAAIAERTVRDDNAELVERARNGEVRAFETLYRSHLGRVFAVCRRMSRDESEAEELTQDVFVRAWERLGSFRGESEFSTWLHRLAVNLVLDRRRSAARRGQREARLDDAALEALPARPSTPGERMDLERAIAALPEGSRTVFVLHDVEGFKHEEIARLTGRAVGTSKAHLHRARMLLREALSV